MKFELKFRKERFINMKILKVNMKRSALLLPLFLLGIVFLFPLISGANTLTINIPSADTLISGTQVITGDLDTNTLNVTNAWFNLMFENGTNVTLALYQFNVTDTQFNFSFVTSDFVDDGVITLWATASNETPTSAINTTAYLTGISIDNGNPTATFSSASANYGYRAKLTETLTYGADADNSIGISSCRVIFTNKEDNTIVDTGTTLTGYACANTSIVLNDIGLSKGGIYDVVIQATDGNGNRTNTTRTLSILTNPASAPVSGVGVSGGGVGQSFIGSIGKIFTASFWSNFWDWINPFN